MSDRQQPKRHTRLVTRLSLALVAMFAFGYALVPLYNVVCDLTGLNGKTGRVAADAVIDNRPDESRLVTVEFVASTNASAPWDFKPSQAKMEVHPGGVYKTTFYARNQTSQELVGQAVPSIAPGEAATYFNKTECFCFSRQAFGPGEGRDMPVQFIVDRDLPSHINSLVLSYTFFKVTEQSKQNNVNGA